MRPNILIFMTDHQRGDMAPPYARAITPHLDRMAREGVTFSQAFCTAPHCCPSRASFWTGLYPSQHGVWNNVDTGNALSRGLFPDTPVFSDALLAAGYRLQFSGKWHVSAVETPVERGWEMGYPPRWIAPDATQPRPHLREWAQYEDIARQPEPTQRGEGQILRPGWGAYTLYGEGPHFIQDYDEKTVADALRFIEARAASPGKSPDPWCQFVGTLGPHDPYVVPQRFLDLYPLDSIVLPPSASDRMLDKPALYRRTRDVFDQLGEREQREALRHYLAFCSYEDDLFGQVLTALERTGQLDDTLVIYLSDHGDYAGEHGLWAKGLPAFRGAYHIPALVRWPRGIARPGRVVEDFISLTDFAPTLLAAAGLAPDPAHAGASLMPFLRGEQPVTWRDAIYTQSNGNELYGFQRSVATRDWKYVLNGFDYDELYDLQADPHELHNLARDPRHADRVRELCGRIWRFAHAHQDACVTNYIMVNHAPWGPAEAFREHQP